MPPRRGVYFEVNHAFLRRPIAYQPSAARFLHIGQLWPLRNLAEVAEVAVVAVVAVQFFVSSPPT